MYLLGGGAGVEENLMNFWQPEVIYAFLGPKMEKKYSHHYVYSQVPPYETFRYNDYYYLRYVLWTTFKCC